LRHEYGLDQPFLIQYFLWMQNVLVGNRDSDLRLDL